MASNPIKRKNKDDGTNSSCSAEPKVRRVDTDPTACQYGRDFSLNNVPSDRFQENNSRESPLQMQHTKQKLIIWESHLSIDTGCSNLIEKLKINEVLILGVDTASDKSTRIVQYLVDTNFSDKRKILFIQPRISIMQSLAAHVANDEPLTLSQNQIKFISDTAFYTEYQNNPTFEQYSVVIINVAHDQNIDTAVVLGLMKKCMNTRKDLKLIVISAALDMHSLYNYFASNFPCDVLEAEDRDHPIGDIYLNDDDENYIQAAVAKVIELHNDADVGDILVFLTNQAEIRLALNNLNTKLRNDNSFLGLPFYEELPENEVARIFEEIADRRKIIFSTNIAESSVSFNRIKYVIDSGMVKEELWDEQRKMQMLKIGPTTKSSVLRRRAKAGTVPNGKCYHLYSVETYESMGESSHTGILYTQLAITILKLKYLNIDNIESFEWLQPPSISMIQDARQLLVWLNAIDTKGALTVLGKTIALLGIDPKLIVMLYKAQELDCLSYALILAGMLKVSQNIWQINEDTKSRGLTLLSRVEFSLDSGDHAVLVNIFLKWSTFCRKHPNKREQSEWCKNNCIDEGSLQLADNFMKEKAKQMGHEMKPLDSADFNDEIIHRLLQCITAGYFMNLAVSNGPLRSGYRVISAYSQTSNKSIGARAHPTSSLLFNDQVSKYILFNEFLSDRGTNYLMILSPINLDWLKSVSEDWYKAVNAAKLPTMSYESFALENVGEALLRAIVGRHSCNLNKLEDIAQATIDVDYKQSTLRIWSQSANLSNAKQIVQETVKKEKEKLLIEAEEMHIVGGTRILMSAGGVSERILFADDFVKIILANLPETTTEERVQDLCQPFGMVRRVDFVRYVENSMIFAVTYTTVEQASLAVTRLNGRIEHGYEIVVTRSFVRNPTNKSKQNCFLKAICYLTPSTGNGRILFNNEKSARDACNQLENLNYLCRYQYLRSLPTVKVTYCFIESNRKAFIYFKLRVDAHNAQSRIHFPETSKIIENRQNPGVSLLLEGLSRSDDEEDISSRFQDCEGFTGARILRGIKGQLFQKPTSAEHDIKKMFRHYTSFQQDVVSINPKVSTGRLEASVQFSDRNELERAVLEMNGKIELIGCGKVRLSEQNHNHSDASITKEDKHVLIFERLDLSFDKYDLIKILKENKLYNDVKNVEIYRQSFIGKSSRTEKHRGQSNADTALENLHSIFESKPEIFRSKPQFQTPVCAPDGTLTTMIVFKDPVDIATAIYHYDNRRIRLLRGSSRLRLVPSIRYQILINNHLSEVIPNKIEEAIQYTREKYRRIQVRVESFKKEERSAAMKIIIQGDDVHQITMAKIAFHTSMKGVEYKFKNDTNRIKPIFNHDIIPILRTIQAKTNTYIACYCFHSLIRIYGDNQAPEAAAKCIDEYIESVMNDKDFTIELKIPKGYLQQVLKLGTYYQDMIGNVFSVKIAISGAKRVVKIIGNQENTEKAEEAIKNLWSEVLAEEQSGPKDDLTTSANECPICCETANYNLLDCGHASCLRCLKQELSSKFDTTLSNESLKIKCIMQDCNSVLSLRDIKTIIDPEDMPKLARASFQAFLKTDTDIVQCIGNDCNQVYRKSKHPESYFCDTCLHTYCTKCEIEFHIGITCEQYQKLVTLEKDEKALAMNIGNFISFDMESFTNFHVEFTGNLKLKSCPSLHDVDKSIENSEIEETIEQTIGDVSFEIHEGKLYSIEDTPYRKLYLNFENERNLNELMKIGAIEIHNKRFLVSRYNRKDTPHSGRITPYLLIKSSEKNNSKKTLKDLTEFNIKEYFTTFGKVINFQRNDDHEATLKFAHYDIVDRIILTNPSHEINGVIIDVEKAVSPQASDINYNTKTPPCIHVSRLPHDVTSEELAQTFGAHVANIIIKTGYQRNELQSASQDNCEAWIINTGNERQTRDLAGKHSGKQLHGLEIQCNVTHEPIYRFELCRKFRLGSCSYEKRCIFKHILCSKLDDCLDKECRYGHSRKRKVESDVPDEDEDCEDDFYRLKISNLPIMASKEKLTKLLKLKDNHTSRLIFNERQSESLSSKVAYVIHQPALKYLQTQVRRFHDQHYSYDTLNKMKCQIEINPNYYKREDKHYVNDCPSTTDSEQSNISNKIPSKRRKIDEISPFDQVFTKDEKIKINFLF
ncbi:unnamed protein product [Rotaria magnacalcarata]|uniref:RNA helicase n=1 Tax=Rotaria magnacalcarata TaxID=392030 RepID=A0A814I8G8_9BILA|nr:unnamed protein product [Rotaria magnacalcarata]